MGTCPACCPDSVSCPGLTHEQRLPTLFFLFVRLNATLWHMLPQNSLSSRIHSSKNCRSNTAVPVARQCRLEYGVFQHGADLDFEARQQARILFSHKIRTTDNMQVFLTKLTLGLVPYKLQVNGSSKGRSVTICGTVVELQGCCGNHAVHGSSW